MGTITLPNNPGLIANAQVTDATKVMENFAAIVAEVNGNIEPVNIKALAVETAKLANVAVTAAKLATDAVETLKIKDANVTAAKLAADSVETAKIVADAVDKTKIAADVAGAGIAQNADGSLELAPDDSTIELSGDTLRVKDSGIVTAKIANENVTLAKIVRSTLDTYLKAQGASDPIFEKLALRDTGIKVSTILNRSTAGAQEITGVGFEPSVVIFIACDDTETNRNMSWGWDDGTDSDCIAVHTNNTKNYVFTNKSVVIKRDDSNHLQGSITALSADGFTITWALTGTCAVDVIYLALP